MRFIIGMQLPLRLAGWLRLQGAEAWHASELGFGTASDHRIVAEAVERGAAIITKDGDFLKLSAVRGDSGPVVLLIRTGNCSTADLMAVWQDRWFEAKAALARGERIIVLERDAS